MVHREAIIHQQLQHPNILPFLGIYHEAFASHPLTILPYMEHGSLQHLLDSLEELMELPKFIKLLIGTSRGLVYLHSRQPPIIHGDLHPGNILLGQDGNPFLCDFGRSRIYHNVSRSLSTREEGGRPRFLAPELLDSQDDQFSPNQRSDVFAFAMVALHAWSGQPPFSGINDQRAIAMLCLGDWPRQPVMAVVLNPTTETAFWGLLGTMWAHELSQQPQSIQVLEQLEHILYQCKYMVYVLPC
ncbi:kinase-like protein [Clavulina sp. PMI_390]|nr:kinase-like protein [Clavulina sp. PMI_390]